jgi:hypothetical protein
MLNPTGRRKGVPDPILRRILMRRKADNYAHSLMLKQLLRDCETGLVHEMYRHFKNETLYGHRQTIKKVRFMKNFYSAPYLKYYLGLLEKVLLAMIENKL